MTEVRPVRATARSWLETLVRLSDDQYVLPGTSLRFGWDAILGLLFPGVGDTLTTSLALVIVFVAWREGAGAAVLGRMLLNVAVDALAGTVPVVGDFFDLTFRANRKNYELLLAFRGTLDVPIDSGVRGHLARAHGSLWTLAGLGAIALVFISIPISAALLVGYWLWR